MIVCLGAWLAVGAAQAQEGDATSTPDTTADTTAPSPADTTADSPAGSTADSTAPSPATPVPDRTPKVAIVIAGDTDASALAAACSLEEVLGGSPDVAMPSDAAMRGALRGEGSGDGLDEVRAERRHLGLGEARDVTTLTVLGELAGADLVLVVRSAHGETRATAFDVLRRSFYDGDLALEPIDVEAATRFVARRARRAARPLSPEERAAHAPVATPVVDPTTAVPPEAIAPDPEPPPHEPDFFEQYWPYFAAGALLIGAVVFVVVATQNNGTPPPVLRFEAGGGQ